MAKYVTKQCPVCKKDFTRRVSRNQKHCSPKCQVEARRKKVTKQCPVCKKDFTRHAYLNQKTCSRKCAKTAIRERITKQCPECKEEFTRRPSGAARQKHCSRKCLYAAQRGKPGDRRKDSKGFWFWAPDGRDMWEHRYVMEKIKKRKLLSTEQVHHIDYDKYNNDPQNLFLFTSHSEHMKCHASFNRLVKRLLAGDGILLFNRVTGLYELGPRP